MIIPNPVAQVVTLPGAVSEGVPGPVEDAYALSPMQQGMLFHSLFGQQAGVDIDQLVYTLHEDLDVAAFQRAWQQAVDRHPVLRSSFHWEGLEAPLQQVHRSATPAWQIEDWRQGDADEQRQRLAAYLREDRRRGFVLTEAPLHRMALFRTGDADYEFVWTFYHAILDGRSFLQVLKEAFVHYEAINKEIPAAVPPPRPYRDYIAWLGEQDQTRAEAFWRRTLKGFTSPTPLVINRSALGRMSGLDTYYEQGVQLSADITSTLKTLAAENGVTLNTLVQGAWALLLSRYSGEDDIVFGATRACRHSTLAGAETMVGAFFNTLPMRLSVDEERELLDWLREIRDLHVSLREYEHTSLTKIQEWSDVPRGLPLFDSILVFENYAFDTYLRSLGGRWAGRQFQLLEQTNYPLTLSGWGGPELLLKLAYDRRNFADRAVARMLGHLQTLLEGFAASPRRRLADLPMLTPDEQRQTLTEWNETRADYPDAACVHDLFAAQAARTPEAIALCFQAEQLTYSELNSRANQLAHHLRALGLGPERLAGVAMDRSPQMIVALLAVLKAGGAYVPLDPAYPKERLAAMIDDARPIVLLTQQRLLGRLPGNNARVVCLDLDSPDWRLLERESRDNPKTDVTARNLAYVIYTSGSTGKPKGVMIEHRSLVNYTAGAGKEYAIGPGDRVLQFASINFDASAEEIYPCLTRGATLVLRDDDMLASTSLFLQTCAARGVTVLDLPTAFWHEMTERLGTEDRRLPASLRLVIIGGERALPERLALWHEKVGGSVRLVNTYGPTETTIVATAADLKATAAEGEDEADGAIGREVPIGRPVANTRTYILDRRGRPVPALVPGELYIGGAGVARGYLNQPALTAKSFIRDPFRAGDGGAAGRLYRTGDLARYLLDGRIEFCGRADDQVKIRGFRVELGEIESALAAHPSVRDVIVLCREDAPGEKRLAAYVVCDGGGLGGELRRFLEGKLPAYMIPAAFITLEALPLNASGKVDRKALPAPAPSADDEGRVYVRPKDPLQYQLARIWEELFETRPIGITDNFFELGGHSLLSVRLMDRIEQVFGKKLPLATMFAWATIEHLANALIDRDAAAGAAPLVAIQPRGLKTPFFYLHGDFQGGGMYCLSLARHLGSEQPFYALQPHGLDGQPVPKTIEAMAADHLKTLRAFRPAGPYRLGGHCNGGLVAFEMARRLEAEGEKVEVLALIGTTGENARHRALQDAVTRYGLLHGMDEEERQERFLAMRSRVIRMREVRRYYTERLRELSKLNLRQQATVLRQNGWKTARSLSRLFTTGEAATAGQPAPAEARSVEDRRLLVHAAYARAMENYVPRRYGGRVTLLWPSEWLQGEGLDPAAGWRDVAAEVEVHIVPGGHLTSIIDNMGELAEVLKACLGDPVPGRRPGHR